MEMNMKSIHQNIITKLFEGVWNQRDWDLTKEIFDNNAEIHFAILPNPTLDGFKKIHSEFTEAMPDLHYKVEEVIEDGNRVAVRWSAQATHKNDFGPFKASNKKSDHWGITILDIRDDKISKLWNVEDLAITLLSNSAPGH